MDAHSHKATPQSYQLHVCAMINHSIIIIDPCRLIDRSCTTYFFQGGTLAKISSSEENNLVFALAANAGIEQFWIGGMRVDTQGLATDFVWRDGSSMDYSSWMAGEVCATSLHSRCWYTLSIFVLQFRRCFRVWHTRTVTPLLSRSKRLHGCVNPTTHPFPGIHVCCDCESLSTVHTRSRGCGFVTLCTHIIARDHSFCGAYVIAFNHHHIVQYLAVSIPCCGSQLSCQMVNITHDLTHKNNFHHNRNRSSPTTFGGKSFAFELATPTSLEQPSGMMPSVSTHTALSVRVPVAPLQSQQHRPL